MRCSASRCWGRELTFICSMAQPVSWLLRLVKVMDDTFLSITGPSMAMWLSFLHGLPRATNRVLFEKVGPSHI